MTTDTPPARRRLLILSFSPIAADARVLKQVTEFSGRYEVITCGYGEAPAGVARHIRIPDAERINDLDGRLITLHWYSRAYWRLSAVRWARRALAGLQVDAAIANDVEAVPVALAIRPRFGVHADLHEYSPRLHEEIPAWLKRIKPYYDWLCRRYVSKASSWSTVSEGLAREYARQFGFVPVIVTNAAPYADLGPHDVRDPIRLVHSGACLKNRNLMALVEGVDAADGAATLDLYLTPNDPGLLAELASRASRSEWVEVRDPVPYRELVSTLNGYDVGVHLLPPVNFNNEWALPNKIFDYVQARLGVIVGPSAEMAEVVRQHGFGAVTADFSADGLRRVVADLDRATVAGWKRLADAHARELSSEAQVAVWADCVDGLIGSGAAR
ncbi:glycosyltransferase family 1 protein [Agromyces sp. H3Y2-19a]|uniref:glycosyltransferase family 1 protein n=1 Tax=Agromyces TaxID=33877 RepID=UPI0023BA0DEA|nr:glycosyltransferase family 1 protein [Agromyces chromiiresistens]MDF0514640.1 glycosyltransferase family 1 protein [Agromyces chromiiresistens]